MALMELMGLMGLNPLRQRRVDAADFACSEEEFLQRRAKAQFVRFEASIQTA